MAGRSDRVGELAQRERGQRLLGLGFDELAAQLGRQAMELNDSQRSRLLLKLEGGRIRPLGAVRVVATERRAQ
jgi:hypothetical protein